MLGLTRHSYEIQFNEQLGGAATMCTCIREESDLNFDRLPAIVIENFRGFPQFL
jgi:hypothetical protein